MIQKEETVSKQNFSKFALILGLCLLNLAATAASPAVPEQFQRFDPDSGFVIKYGDVDAILKTMVVDVGRSSREKAEATTAKTGTRMKNKVKRDTAEEGNRFHFEAFDDNEKYQEALHNVRLALEAIPSQVPLEAFNRNEQLAYWLNLYNITLLDELVKIYPEKDLKKELTGNKSLLNQKVVNVSGVSLSLNDIQYGILAGNFDNDPKIMYGLYQGIVGGPNIRKRAYTGENVQRYLQDNAEEFVNSNRGTQDNDGDFEVSSLYERNAQYFPNFDPDLKTHLMRFIEGPERGALQAANSLDPDINDWTITDVYGTKQQIGGSFTDNKAAMLDSVATLQPGPDGATSPQISASFSGASSMVQAKTPSPARFSPEVLTHLDAIRTKVEAANMVKQGTVTVEELGEAPAEPETSDEKDDSDQD
jgi:hypothetical protein